VLAYTVTLTAITNTATASVSLAAYNQMASGFTIRTTNTSAVVQLPAT
jgi:hypothetical protein